MYKKLIRISGIILANLFAFLFFGIILGALFGNKEQFLVLSIIVSIIPLMIFLYIDIQATMKELNNISKEKNDDSNGK